MDRAFIYGMWHHLVAVYQNTSDHGPDVEIGSVLCFLDFTKRSKS